MGAANKSSLSQYSKVAALFASVVLPLQVSAGTIVCSGNVEVLAYHANNKLMLRLSNMNAPVFFCSPDSEWTVAGTTYKTGPETCKTLYSSFMAAKLAGKPINNVWFDGDQVPTGCNGWPGWASANIRYFELN